MKRVHILSFAAILTLIATIFVLDGRPLIHSPKAMFRYSFGVDVPSCVNGSSISYQKEYSYNCYIFHVSKPCISELQYAVLRNQQPLIPLNLNLENIPSFMLKDPSYQALVKKGKSIYTSRSMSAGGHAAVVVFYTDKEATVWAVEEPM